MPFQDFDEEDGYVIRMSGDVAFDEILQTAKLSWEHPNWDRLRYQIWDFSQARSVGVEEYDALAVAKMDNVHNRVAAKQRIALISGNAPVNRLLEAYVAALEPGHVEVRIFQEEAEARAWAVP